MQTTETIVYIYIYMNIVCILHFQVDQEKHSNSMCHIASNLKRQISSINNSHFLENLDDSLRNLHLVSNVSRETYNFALNPYLVDQPLTWLHGWQVLADQLIPGRPTAFDEPSEVAWTLAPDSAIDTSWDGILIGQSSNMFYLWSQHNF